MRLHRLLIDDGRGLVIDERVAMLAVAKRDGALVIGLALRDLVAPHRLLIDDRRGLLIDERAAMLAATKLAGAVVIGVAIPHLLGRLNRQSCRLRIDRSRALLAGGGGGG